MGKKEFGNPARNINRVKDDIQLLQKNNANKINLDKIKTLQDGLDNLLLQKETWWGQRAKAHWLREREIGKLDFFHIKASQNHNRNNIKYIVNKYGIITYKEEEIQDSFVNYFKDLFHRNTYETPRYPLTNKCNMG